MYKKRYINFTNLQLKALMAKFHKFTLKDEEKKQSRIIKIPKEYLLLFFTNTKLVARPQNINYIKVTMHYSCITNIES